jgi:hypothetical protein
MHIGLNWGHRRAQPFETDRNPELTKDLFPSAEVSN